MSDTEKTIEVLNDLVQINNDRLAGFQDALKNLDPQDVDLKALFDEYSDQSRKFSQELSALVGAHGGDVETSKSASGALHRAWIDVKAVFTGNDRTAILEEAERGEDQIKKAYKDALNTQDVVLPQDAVSLIQEQQAKVNSAHDNIKALRDAHKAL